VLSIIGYGSAIVETDGKFNECRHNMAVAMRVFHGGRFLHHGMLTVNGDSGKGEKEVERWRRKAR